MREKVACFYVADREYKIACENGSTEISIEYMTDYNIDLKKMDFILICNKNQYVLRNFWQLNEKNLTYTSCLIKNGTDISLQAVSTLCYEFIMHIRLDAYRDTHTKTWFFLKDLKSVEYNIKGIVACIDFIEGIITAQQFMEQLVDLEQKFDDFCFQSTNALIQKCGWNNQCDENQKKVIDTIRQECLKMENLLKNKKEWRNIWQVAYGIHNLPDLFVQ